MKLYYIHDGVAEQGPFQLEELNTQNLQGDTPVWYEGLENWSTADQIEELKHIVKSKPTTPPFTKTQTETKAVPPQFKQVEEEIKETPPPSYNELYPVDKKAKLRPILIAAFIVLGTLLSWGIWHNNESLGSLKEKVNTQETKKSEQESATDKAEQERQRINRATTAKNTNFRNNWQNYITVRHSEPQVDYTLGGISSFETAIQNETDYMLDQVDVYIEYIRKNGNVYQAKTVSIFNIPAGASGSATAPSSINGVKVNCMITKIVSKKMHFCYPDGSGDRGDPYFCR